MPKRTIYVADSRVGLFEEAALMAGSLSAAINEGIELYVGAKRAGRLRHTPIEVSVGRGRSRRTKRFRGREIDEFLVENRTANRHDGVTVYLTRGGRIAVWRWSDPDWSAVRKGVVNSVLGEFFATPMTAEEVAAETDDRGLDDWFERRGEDFLVFEDLDAMQAEVHLDDEDLASLRAQVDVPVVEVLDI